MPPPNPAARAADLRTALRLTYITLAWMTIEGVASITLGLLSRSILLEAFGIDSAIELFSALVLLWRLRVETGGKADDAQIERVERRASRLAGYALYVLALYVLAGSVFGLFAHYVTDTHKSDWGILIGVVAAVGMPFLAKYKLRVAADRPAEFQGPSGRCDGSLHLRLSINRVDCWLGGHPILWIVVA